LNFLSGNEKFQECWNEDKSLFEFGSIPGSSKEIEKSNAIKIEKYHFYDFSQKLKLRISGEDFLVSDENHQSVRNEGKIIHDILSEINTKEEIEIAVLKAVNSGLLIKSEAKKITETLRKSIDSLGIKSWFDGTYTVLNERSLLTTDRVLRPDRIMISAEKTIVVDYKTGEKKSEQYNKQVLRYAQTLKEAGQKNVYGYLWYIRQNIVEKVCEL